VETTPALRRRFEQLYCGIIYDSLHFDLGYRDPFVADEAIKPAWKLRRGQVLFGHAFTCKGQLVLHETDINDQIRIRMFDEFTPGCVQVIATDGDDSVAHFGDISGEIARKFGCNGVVIDGNTRDVRRLEAADFVTFCRGVQPIDAYGRWQITEYQTTVSIRGIQGYVKVSPGDYVFADPDGVLFIPEQLGEQVCELAEIRLTKEDQIRNSIESASSIQDLYDRIGRW
jgi:regulator of RNase E activity RraA